MIGEAVIEFADLQRLSGFTRLADVERWARDNGVPVKPCRKGLWTTLQALNDALGVGPAANADGGYGRDVI